MRSLQPLSEQKLKSRGDSTRNLLFDYVRSAALILLDSRFTELMNPSNIYLVLTLYMTSSAVFQCLKDQKVEIELKANNLKCCK